jgi:hypothetical protein
MELLDIPQEPQPKQPLTQTQRDALRHADTDTQTRTQTDAHRHAHRCPDLFLTSSYLRRADPWDQDGGHIARLRPLYRVPQPLSQPAPPDHVGRRPGASVGAVPREHPNPID